MKKLSPYRPLLMALCLTFSACNDYFDNIQPSDDLPIDAVFTRSEDLENAMIGVYNTLQKDGLAGLNLIVFPALLSDNGTFNRSGFPDFLDISNQNMRASNHYAEQTWISAYEAINAVNIILAALETIDDGGLTEAKKNRIKGEGHFIRGVLFFELVRLYALPPWNNAASDPGIVIMNDPIKQSGDLSFPFRNTVQEVYNAAKADLELARNLLPENRSSSKANPFAATAYLAEMAFQEQDYARAAQYGAELIQSKRFELAPSLPDFFTEKAAVENIWSVAYTPGDANGAKNTVFHESLSRVQIHPELKAAFKQIVTAEQKAALVAENLRAVDLRVHPSPGALASHALISSDTTYTNKYEDIQGKADDTPMMRYAEILLLQAESLARTGDLQGSVELLNQIRARSLRILDADGNEVPEKLDRVLFDADNITENVLIEAIILERRVELCFEGNYFHDLMRLERGVNNLSFDDCRLRLPIPQREVDVNPNLVQNPCY